MNKQTKSIFDFFKKEEPKKVNFSEVQTVDGITLYYEGELVVKTEEEEGTKIFVLDAENNQIPAPEGDFQIEMDGKIWVISIDVNGILSAMEEVMEDDKKDEPAPGEEFVSKKEFDAIIQKIIEDADSRISKIEENFEALSTKKESKFKDEKTKTGNFTAITVREILTKK
jgi:hypothetical protein